MASAATARVSILFNVAESQSPQQVELTTPIQTTKARLARLVCHGDRDGWSRLRSLFHRQSKLQFYYSQARSNQSTSSAISTPSLRHQPPHNLNRTRNPSMMHSPRRLPSLTNYQQILKHSRLRSKPAQSALMPRCRKSRP